MTPDGGGGDHSDTCKCLILSGERGRDRTFNLVIKSHLQTGCARVCPGRRVCRNWSTAVSRRGTSGMQCPPQLAHIGVAAMYSCPGAK